MARKGFEGRLAGLAFALASIAACSGAGSSGSSPLSGSSSGGTIGSSGSGSSGRWVEQRFQRWLERCGELGDRQLRYRLQHAGVRCLQQPVLLQRRAGLRR